MPEGGLAASSLAGFSVGDFSAGLFSPACGSSDFVSELSFTSAVDSVAESPAGGPLSDAFAVPLVPSSGEELFPADIHQFSAVFGALAAASTSSIQASRSLR